MPGKTWVLLADQQTVYGAFVLGDQLRPGAKTLIQALQQQRKTSEFIQWRSSRGSAIYCPSGGN
jgi:cation transport ATPase